AQHVTGGVRLALAAAPKDPGTVPRGHGSDWTPSAPDAMALAYRLEALQKPLDAMGRALGGDVHPAAVDTLNTTWPALMAALHDELAFADTDGLPPERVNGYSALTGSPMSGLVVPANVVALQGMYLPGGTGAASQRTPG